MKEEPKPLSSLIASALRSCNLESTVDKTMVEIAYRNVVGDFLCKLTWKLDFHPQTGVLYLKLGSPSMKQEFSYKLGDLIEAINNKLSVPAVKKIVLL